MIFPLQLTDTYTLKVCSQYLSQESKSIIPNRNATDKEQSAIRSVVGQLNWLANISRPEISSQLSNINARVTKATGGWRLYCLPTNSTTLVQYLGSQIRYVE